MTFSLLQGSSGDELLSVAKERHDRLTGLVLLDPGAVLRMAIDSQTRLGLPTPIRDFVEESVELDGTVQIFVEDSTDGSRRLTFLDTDAGERYALSFTSEPPSLQTGERVRVRGVRVGHSIALDPGSENLQSGGAGLARTEVVSALNSTLGAQRTAVILVNFSNNPVQPYTAAEARNVVFTTTSNFDLENSYGQTWLTGDVFGWYTIPMSSGVCDAATLASQAQAAVAAAGVNLSGYNHQVYAFPDNACGWWGLGTVGGSPSQAWVNGSLQMQVVGHEMGHNFGLDHSHSLGCGAAALSSNCTMTEYGDTLDTMGYSAYHFNAFQKERLGWLNAGVSPPLTTVLATGTYTIDAYETVGGASKALKIPRGTTGSYFYVEARRGIGLDAGLASKANVSNGVVIHMASPGNSQSSNLLDMTGGGSFNDPALTVGQSFTDSDVKITVNSAGFSGASVTVTMGASAPPPPPPPSCSRVMPAISLVSSQAVGVAAGTTASFAVSVTNRDGSACAASLFSLSSAVPAGWTGTFESAALSVLPGATASTNLQVTAAASAANGSYLVAATAKSSADATLLASASASDLIKNPINASIGASFSDDFNRAAAASLQGPWLTVAGGFSISSNELANSPTQDDSVAVVPSLAGANQVVSADFASTHNGSNPRLGVVLRYQDPQNYYLLYRNIDGSKARISRILGGVEAVLASVNQKNPAENVFSHLTGRVTGTTLTLEIDGAVVAIVTDTAFARGAVGISLGVTGTDARPQRADNFTATIQ